MQRLIRVLSIALVCALASTSAYAQGAATSSITGMVVDSSGGVIPGATVTVKNTATTATYTATTIANGTFTVPAIAIGTYSVTVTLSGFKTAVLNDVAVTAGGPANVKATLDVGGLQETVVVESAGTMVQTQATAVSTTLGVNQISNLPLVSRNALDFLTSLPGVNTPGGNRDSTVNGLPQSTINITVDGMNVQDNYLKTTDGFFARMSPRLDAVEEVTVTSAAQGADSAGQGAVQIKFVTRSGSNTFSGSAYHYFRSDALNANTWFNERDQVAKPELRQNQPGIRAGGPIVLPGLFDGRGRAFFFANYEEFRQPQTITRNRTIFSPEAQAGLFRYETNSGLQTVDLLALAARNGEVATVDPTIATLLGDIHRAALTTGTISNLTDPNLQRYTWNVDQRSLNRYTTTRLDFNLSSRHRLSTSVNFQHITSNPDTLNNRDPIFPGFPATASQDSYRYTVSGTLRSTFRGSMVNELLVGGTGGPTYFFKELTPAMWGGTSLADQGGYLLNISTANISNASNGPTPSSREASTKVIEDTINWVRGTHGFNFGMSFTQADVWVKNQTLVPSINFDVLTDDPAKAMFSTATLPGSSSTHRGDAEDLYAVLVGRIGSIGGEARLDEQTNQYVFLGPSLQRGRLRDVGLWAQDAWRPRTDLTINFGLRYELQVPFSAKNDSYSTTTPENAWGLSGLSATCTDFSRITPETCNLFKPGLTPGSSPVYLQLNRNQHAYGTDLNNLAPSVGVAWTPSSRAGFLEPLLGQPGDSVLRAGFARAFNRPGMSDFTGRLDDNPGIQITANRDTSLGNLGELPVLFRQTDRLGPPDFPPTRDYPMTDVVTGDIQVFDPHLQVPYADSWTAGFQRGLGRTMAVEARYVGTRSRQNWVTYNVNELNIIENGFLDEFMQAQGNLQANLAAGRGANFRYFGPGTGTAPLPVFLAYFSGRPASAAGDPARYTSGNFASSTYVNPLAVRNPQPFTAANALDSTAGQRANALAAGLPANFLVANPDALGGAEIDSNGGYTNYHSLQLELRRRLANGLQFQSSYVYGRGYGSSFYSFRVPRKKTLDTGAEGGVTHAFKLNWTIELPFGAGRRFGGGVGTGLDRLIGGWQFHGVARVQSGRLVDFGNVRLVGFTRDELAELYRVRRDADQRVWMLPQDIIDNTIKAFSVNATSPTGYSDLGAPSGRYFAPANGPDCLETIADSYGDCGERTLVVPGPVYKNVDLSVVKLVPLAGRVRAEFRFEMLNAFNFTNYVPVTGIGSDPTDYEVTGLNGATTSRIVQIVSRITW